MSEHQLVVVTGPGRDVPARVAGLLLPLDIEISSMQFSRQPDPELWWIQLAVRVPSEERLALLTKRLNRIVDVTRVVTVGPQGHRRQSVYLRLRPDVTDLVHIGELTRWFRAETLELNTEGMVLHLTASPERCADFVSMLRPHGVIEIMTTACSGFRTGSRTISGAPLAVAQAY
nr:acetolactate synthase small subunit [Rhodococcus wratislaviensis]GLK33437.1 acetolactate synthase small subunit [Rhodococcus wratislaviensis]